jgi:hypothetical protein
MVATIAPDRQPFEAASGRLHASGGHGEIAQRLDNRVVESRC